MKPSQIVYLFTLAIASFGDASPLPKHHKISKRSDPVVQFLLDDTKSLLDLNQREDARFNELELTGQTNYEHNCTAVITNPDAPVFMRSTCPWYFVRDHKATRYPVTFLKAELKCKATIGCLGDPLKECMPINQEINVLESTGHHDSSGNLVFQTQKIQVPVGFTCSGRKLVTDGGDTVNTTQEDDPFNK